MKRLGKFKTLAIASLSAIALAGSIAVAQKVKTGQGADRDRAGAHCLSINMDGASATLSDPATKFRAGQPDRIAQRP